MTDKMRNQQRLARDLAELVDVLSTQENQLGFLTAFWQTIAREWGAIDALRMDKYLYLVRCYVNKGFELCAKKGWAEDEVFLEEYLQILEATPLNPREAKIPDGLRYHVIDIFVDELDKADLGRNVPMEKVLGPLRTLGKETITKTVRERVNEALEDERLQDWKAEMAVQQDDEGGAEGISAQEGAAQGEDEEFGGFGD
jgi:ribosomal RNA-processing protein 1